MPLQWMTDHLVTRVRSIVGASLVGALGGEGGFPPKHADPINRVLVPMEETEVWQLHPLYHWSGT